jgi:hypothetical protein
MNTMSKNMEITEKTKFKLYDKVDKAEYTISSLNFDENGLVQVSFFNQHGKLIHAPIKELEVLVSETEIEDTTTEQNEIKNADTSVVGGYFDDLEKWMNSFYCNECGCDKITDFAYDRTVSNGQVWHCKHCETEIVVGNKPNEDKYWNC